MKQLILFFFSFCFVSALQGVNYAYVTDYSRDAVVVIDLASDTISKRVHGINGNPRGIAITPDGKRAYIVTDFSDIYVMETKTNTIIDKITLYHSQKIKLQSQMISLGIF